MGNALESEIRKSFYGITQIKKLIFLKCFLFVSKLLGALWVCDYRAMEKGMVGLHAELKSGLHSDVFFVSKILLKHKSIRKIFSYLIFRNIKKQKILEKIPSKLIYVVGVPNGATVLGQDISKFLNLKLAIMEKIDGKLVLKTKIEPGSFILIIEDVCTRGTGFKEAVAEILSKQSRATIIPYNFNILNRGGLSEINIENVGRFQVVSLVEIKANDWDPKDCPLCRLDSKPIPPKKTEENWMKINNSQKRV